MAVIIKKAKPTSPGVRFSVSVVDTELHKGRPKSNMVSFLKKKSGRNSAGRITVRHKGGGHKRYYRIIDFKRNKDGIEGKIERFEYDPNRSANIALVRYIDGDRRYILAPKNLQLGSIITSGAESAIKIGNALSLDSIPVGTTVHAVEMKPGKGAQISRSAGSSAQIVGKEDKYTLLRLQSGEMRKILSTCRATIGEVGNIEHSLRKLGKAGASRWRGVRPTVRGVAMNPVDHPHGGGEGKTSGGRNPVSPWGLQSKGKKTRTNKRSDNMIIRKRGKK